LRRAFSVHAPYLRGPDDSDERDGYDFHERGPEMSRAFRALKLWMTLRHFGTRRLREAYSRSLGLAQHLHGLVRDHPDFEVLHDPVSTIVSFRCVPNELADRQDEPDVHESLDRLNQEIAESVQRSGLAFVMTTRIRGRLGLRMSICSQRTTISDIDATFEALAHAARRITIGPTRERC
jgi:glutamate/tyrosine decarboxylase-like PLP-dependent enzyme